MFQKLGLIGFPLTHSFSKRYFTEKFEKENLIGFSFELFPIENITDLPKLLIENPDLIGLSVTIPYKKAVIPYLTDIDDEARKVGAVNFIAIQNNKLKGYNTDIYGFEFSLLNLLGNVPKDSKALVLGNGGAAEAVKYVLNKLNIPFLIVTRKKEEETRLTFDDLTPEIIENHLLIVNCTPLGTFPNIETCPPLPYEALTEKHFLFDLVYNPTVTKFLQYGINKKANVQNGLEMLEKQADRAFFLRVGFSNQKI